MAVTPQNNDAFFREVDDEVRREQMQTMARRYGAIVVGLIVVALVALAALLGWRSHQETVAGERGERFTAAMSSISAGATVDATKQLGAIVKDGGGYAQLARLLQADMLVQQNKQPEAAAAFLAVSRDDGVSQPLRDLALVRATTLSVDTLAPAEVIARMKPLAVAGTPWFGSAGELTGIAYLRLGQKPQAGRIFAAVAEDKSVPQSIRARVGQLAADAGIQVVQPADIVRS